MNKELSAAFELPYPLHGSEPPCLNESMLTPVQFRSETETGERNNYTHAANITVLLQLLTWQTSSGLQKSWIPISCSLRCEVA